jgi:hypothetical protein
LQIYPAVVADLGTTLTEEGDIPYWGESALAALHHGLQHQVLMSGGHGEAPYWDSIAQNGWVEDDNTWLYSSADAPNYLFTISGDQTTVLYPGMRLKCTQSGAVKYFIIVAVSYSSPNTIVTVYGGTDYALTNNAISSNYYSSAKAPLGFPLNPEKWSVTFSDTANRSQSSPTTSQWYNPGSMSITVPIGAWVMFFKASIYLQYASAADRWAGVTCGLATSLGTAPLTDFAFCVNMGGTFMFILGTGSITQNIALTSKTTYYIAISTDGTSATAISVDGLDRCAKTTITAVCAYL